MTRVRRRAGAWLRTRRRGSWSVRRRFAGLPAAAAGPALLVAPPGAGNIGDQAMVEAYLEGTPGEVLLVVRRADDLDVPPQDAARVRVVALPHLVYGEGAARRADLERYARLVGSASEVAVVGADMLDGVYTVVGSVRRVLLAELAAVAGRPTRVLGFSWSPRYRAAALIGLRAAAQVGADLVVRDPESAMRLANAGVGRIVVGADVVFTATSRQPVAVPGLDPDRPYALLNVSALVRRSTAAAEYLPVVQHLRRRGMQVVLVPHVLRGTSDDAAACREVHVLAGGGTLLVEDRLAPPQVRTLAAGARVVVTGRMHLAVMAATVGVPAITFSTQGKVRGMLGLFGLEQLCVEPGPDAADRVLPVLDLALDDPAVRRALEQRLDDVRRLAAQNFRRVPAAAGAGR